MTAPDTPFQFEKEGSASKNLTPANNPSHYAACSNIRQNLGAVLNMKEVPRRTVIPPLRQPTHNRKQ